VYHNTSYNFNNKLVFVKRPRIQRFFSQTVALGSTEQIAFQMVFNLKAILRCLTSNRVQFQMDIRVLDGIDVTPKLHYTNNLVQRVANVPVDNAWQIILLKQ